METFVSSAQDCTSERPWPADELIIQHLGASVLLCWHDLPLTVQGQILAQSNDVVGVAPISGIRDQIVRLVLRRAPRW